jgi:hypothetical protein
MLDNIDLPTHALRKIFPGKSLTPCSKTLLPIFMHHLLHINYHHSTVQPYTPNPLNRRPFRIPINVPATHPILSPPRPKIQRRTPHHVDHRAAQGHLYPEPHAQGELSARPDPQTLQYMAHRNFLQRVRSEKLIHVSDWSGSTGVEVDGSKFSEVPVLDEGFQPLL